ncbi:MAG: serine/threonine-protein phosphatase [Oscillospiraceae bacterium]|nr:serine/threonine-protein phosphatase [Oscillospiraceae bacterium]
MNGKDIIAAGVSGIGERKSQQDAFCMSEIGTEGFVAVLCDGMGGMLSGSKISAEVSEKVLALCKNSSFEEDISAGIAEINKDIYSQYDGEGGTTLVAARIENGKLRFWSVGDSDIWLIRDGRAYRMNRHHNYRYELYRAVINGKISVKEAEENLQKETLTQYIGAKSVKPDKTRRDFALQKGDTVMLCSDGVSKTLSIHGIVRAASHSPEDCCKELDEEIKAAKRPDQDNYSAVFMRFCKVVGE